MTTPLTPVIYLSAWGAIGTGIGAAFGCLVALINNLGVATQLVQGSAMIGSVIGATFGLFSYAFIKYKEHHTTEGVTE
jgi:hypothetical protein